MKPSVICHAATSQPPSTVTRAPSPVPADEKEQRQRDAATRQDVQVAVLRELPRRVRERRSGRRRTDPADAELPRQQVRAEEREPVRDQEEERCR